MLTVKPAQQQSVSTEEEKRQARESVSLTRAELEDILIERYGGGQKVFWHVWPDGNLERVTVYPE